MATEAQKKASAKYDKNNTKLIQLKLNKKTDGDILDFLDQLDNRQGFIKELIRKEIAGVGSDSSPEVITKRVIEGNLVEGEFIRVSIDGREFRRKVYHSEKHNDLAIIIYGNEYTYSEFKF